MIYLDYNATSKVRPCVTQYLSKWAKNFGNASSLHGVGRMAREQIEVAREKTADFLGVSPYSLIFESSGTEANNHVLQALLLQHPIDEIHIISSQIEHSSVRNTLFTLQKKGVQVTFLPVDDTGVISISDLESAFTSKTKLVSLMAVNNETGRIQPVHDACRIAHAHGALFHTDAVQAVGKVSVEAQDFDFMTFSGHKLGALKGVAGLVVKNPTSFSPILWGGNHEQTLRPGTENGLAIASLGAVCQQLKIDRAEESARLGMYKSLFWNAIQDQVPETRLNGALSGSVSNTLNVSFLGVDGHALAIRLDLAGIAVSTGSACSTGSIEPSKTLLAMGISSDEAKSAIRFSWGFDTTEGDLLKTAAIISEIVAELRNLS